MSWWHLGCACSCSCRSCAQNSWSSVGYANLAATFPTPTGEPDWDLIRQRRVDDIVPCIWQGPYFHRKAERIHALLTRAFDDSGGLGTSLEQSVASAQISPSRLSPQLPLRRVLWIGSRPVSLHTWPSHKVREYLMGISGISGKSVACLMLYRMGRVDFAVDANVRCSCRRPRRSQRSLRAVRTVLPLTVATGDTRAHHR